MTGTEAASGFFDGFALEEHEVAEGVRLRVRHAGDGPAVVLLHGHPRTHTTWYAVAPALVRAGLRVVCPDLRGYGGSSGPVPDAAHEQYCDRTMARDVVTLMARLGHDRFAVVGHDRGSYVAFRAALDHPDVVTALAVLDSVPILEALERADARFARRWWHWFFFDTPQAERAVLADPLAWYDPDPELMGPDNHRDLVTALGSPDTIRAMLADYRAGLHLDADHDRAAREAGLRVRCPVLAAWSAHDDMEDLYGRPDLVWRDWCALPVATAVLESGHHMAEEAPAQLAEVIVGFLAGSMPGTGADR